MSRPVVARMYSKCWIINVYISCLCLATIVGMDQQETYQTCEDLTCENSNACHASLINGTLASHAYCTCKGEWAGLRCEVKLIVSTRLVTTEKVTLEMHGLAFSGRGKMMTFEDMYISEMSVGVWNLNTSDHCLLLQLRDPAQSGISLGGLIKDQEYLACVTNGFVDSCSIFSQRLFNTSDSTNCIYFKTRLFDEPHFDFRIVAVPTAALICLFAATVLLYSQRHSLLVQLCLNKVFCRNCYCCRRRIHRRRRLMHKQRDISGEGLMTPDLPADFESMSASHTEATGDSSHRWIHSSNSSPSTSRRSAYSLDDASAALPATLEHNTFLYEDQSLIPPLYSPQDHKVMTLTYIDEDFIPLTIDTSSFTNPLHSHPYKHSPIKQDQQGITNCSSLPQQFLIPGSVTHENKGNHFTPSNYFQDTSEPCTGPVKPQYLIHPYLHRPYNKTQLFQHQARSKHPRSRFSNSEYGLRYRESNQPFLNQRPCSLPLTQTTNDPSRYKVTNSSLFESNNLKFPHKAHMKDSREGRYSPMSSWSKIFPHRDKNIRSFLAANPTRLTHLLSSPSRYRDIFKRDRQDTIASHSCSSEGHQFTSNTLPRFRKPRLALKPHTVNDMQNFLHGNEHRSNKPCLSVLPQTSNNIPDFWLGYDKPINFALPQTMNNLHDSWHSNQTRSDDEVISALPHATSNPQTPWLRYKHASETPLTSSPASQRPTWLDINTREKDQHFEARSLPSTPVVVDTSTLSQPKPYNKHVKSLISHFEHNLSFLKPSKSHRPTDEEKEFRDLQSPLAEDRIKVSKKSRRSSFSRSSSRDTPTPTNQNPRYSFTSGVHIFEGHPSDHILPPFSTDDEDDDDEVTENSTFNDISNDTSSTSLASGTRQNTISSYNDDDSNLVTPFVTDDSSDDDTYKDINSLSGSMETLQDDNLEAGHSLLSYRAVSDDHPLV